MRFAAVTGFWSDCYRLSISAESKTLRELISTKNDANKYNRIRQLSRLVYQRSDKPKVCVICGYDKHVEISHIKGISEFELDAPISEVNALANLTALCRNHHWELHHGLITIPNNAH